MIDLEQGRAFDFLGLAGRARVCGDAVDQLFELLTRGKQRNRVVVALAHLAAIKAGQGCNAFFHHGFGQGKVFAAVDVVEAGSHVARHLQMLDLIAAYGHFVGVEDQDVCAHQHGVHEEACGHAVIRLGARSVVFVYGCFVGMGAVEQAFAGHTGQEPGQLGNLGDVRLAVEGDVLWVQTGGQPAGGNLDGGALHALGVLALDERVVVGQKVEVLYVFVAAGLNGGAHHACVVAKVGRAAGGDAGQETGSAHRNQQQKSIAVCRACVSAARP